ncbi:hypothetical protein D3854_01120 [Streptococcus mutans]|nr:hypothetical protein [Streptococcus mutans]NLQ50848.1 hypothetical protein [Streptococcus mutans]NLQ68258.1 hypothetical protein [Streptococcus mutans]NLQ81955.1 hypothetical protein [Streptococcus mutans]NLQ85256.1 hypothetical protein [Streptococcus mutans]
MTSQTILRITPPTGLQANIDVMLTLFIIDISNAISAASLTISITGITPSAFTISLALLLWLTLSILKTLLRQPQDHQSYKYRFCRTRFGLVSLKRDTEKFKT